MRSCAKDNFISSIRAHEQSMTHNPLVSINYKSSFETCLVPLALKTTPILLRDFFLYP